MARKIFCGTLLTNSFDKTLAKVPLRSIEGIMCFSYKGASPALMGRCGKLGISMAFYSPRGHYYCSVLGEENRNVLLRREQFRVADDEQKSLRYAKSFIVGKLYNAKWVLERTKRDHALRVNIDRLAEQSGKLSAALLKARKSLTVDELRGVEGLAAKDYFYAFRVDSSPISKEYAIMAALENKIDFAIAFAVNNANPNGDPLNGNRPRTTSEGLGEVSDVALKRKIRNRLQDAGESVFVQSDDRSDDGAKSLSDRFNTYLKTLPKDEQKQKNVVFGKVCERWLDVRSFGQVFAFKKAKDTDEVSIGVRGPVSIQPAFSINPIAIDDVQITKSVNSETTDSGKKSSDTMGMKYRVSGRAVYVTYGSISPQLAERTGFSAEDAEKIKEALVTLFENDESSARPSGSMEVLDVVWFAHNCKGGQYSSAKVHRSVSIDADGTVNVDDASIPGLRYEVIEGR